MKEEEMNRKLMEQQQIELMKKTIFFKILTKEARNRLNMVRAGHPELAAKAELVLLQAIQAGQLKGTVTEDDIKEILSQLKDDKQFTIRR
jgi:DNA-binding TFAR19-related protein (PDSD5 family)